MPNTYLQTLTDKQLDRQYRKLKERIFWEFRGGTQYGVDLETLRVCYPGLYDALMLYVAEGRRRIEEGLHVSH